MVVQIFQSSTAKNVFNKNTYVTTNELKKFIQALKDIQHMKNIQPIKYIQHMKNIQKMIIV